MFFIFYFSAVGRSENPRETCNVEGIIPPPPPYRIGQNLERGAMAPLPSPCSDGPVFHFCSGLLPAAASAKIFK